MKGRKNHITVYQHPSQHHIVRPCTAGFGLRVLISGPLCVHAGAARLLSPHRVTVSSTRRDNQNVPSRCQIVPGRGVCGVSLRTGENVCLRPHLGTFHPQEAGLTLVNVVCPSGVK